MAERMPGFRLNRRSPLAKGLVFAGLGGMNCPGTSLYADSSGYGASGTLTNMDPASAWLWDATLGRWVLGFDGTNDYCVVANAASFNIVGQLTILGFAKRIVNTKYSIPFARRGGLNAAQLQYQLTWCINTEGSNGIRLNLRAGGSLKTVTGAAHNVVNEWHHIAGVYNKTNMAVAYDGVFDPTVTNVTADIDSFAQNGYIGFDNDSGIANYSNAVFSDILIYSRALSPSEIAQLADPSNVMLSGLILPPKRRFWSVSAAAPTYRFPLELMGAY